MNLFAVKDMKAGLYLKPFFEKTLHDAVRKWEVLANEGNESMFARFPHDFRLIHLAQFDELTGRLSIFEDQRDCGSAADFQRKPAEPLPMFPQSAVSQ